MNLTNVLPLTSLTSLELTGLLPIFFLSFGGLLSLIIGTHKEKGRGLAFMTSFLFIAASLVAGMMNLFSADVTLIGGTIVMNGFTKSVGLMLMLFTLIGVVLTYGQDKKEGLLAEVYGLLLFSTVGMILMVSTTNLLFMFISLEIMSFAIYVLVSMRRASHFSAEAGLKYFILGGLASVVFLYGISLVFGATGSFELSNMVIFLTSGAPIPFIFYIGLGFIVCSMLFKVGAFPFHSWIPDVYQGATTSVTGFMGAAVKFTAFLAFARITQSLVFIDDVPGLEWFQHFIWLVAAASMIYGNFVAISQNEIKRMLSFSTIAHTGYLLLGLYAMNQTGQTSEDLVLYLFFYALANLGVFAVISLFEVKNQKDLTLDQIAGLGAKHPVMGALFTIFLLSMAGIPMTSGFIGKYGLFSSAVNAGEVPLVVIAVLTSVVGVFYYLRVIVYLFMKESTLETAKFQSMNGASLAAFLSAAATLQFGLFPQTLINFIKMITR